MDLLRLEQQRQALEQSLQSLRSSLKLWHTWEAEYEGLKEEIEFAGQDADETVLRRISKTYDGELVNEKEILDITGLAQQSPRTAPQILGMISRRQEYVQKNIETIQRRFWDAEAKLEELDFAARNAAHRNGDGSLPLTEIHEELDDDDNLISSSISHPEADTSQLMHSLRKAGLSDKELSALSDAHSSVTGIPTMADDNLVTSSAQSISSQPQAESVTNHQSADSSSGDKSSPRRPPVRKKSVSFTADTKAAPKSARTESEDGKRSVTFAEKIAVAPAAPVADTRSVSFSPKIEEIPAQSADTQSEPTRDSNTQKALRTFFKPGEKVFELDDDDELAATHVVMPEHESPEDAQMRREMLEYHLNEVGHVVAEMDLYDDDDIDGEDTTSASDFAPSEHVDEDTPHTSGESESEDEFGRTTRRVISDDYHKEMQELQRRLIGNLGPAPTENDLSAVDPKLDPQDVRRLVIREKRGSVSSASSDGDKKAKSQKRVSFSKALDVADSTSPPLKAAKTQAGENVAPVRDNVAERTMKAPQRTSKFAQSRAAGAAAPTQDPEDNDHSGPPGKIIADQLIERPTVTSRNAPAIDDEDDQDPVMQQRQLAAEYYRRRNDLIQQQGGFKQEADDENDGGELMEEKGGKLKKVSRFKAARIRS